jgi:hypothetical protein
MTDTADTFARIDAALAEDFKPGQWSLRAALVKARALIPESPTDDEHDALTDLLMRWEGLHPEKADLIADAIFREGFHRTPEPRTVTDEKWSIRRPMAMRMRGGGNHREKLRAALEAALGTPPEPPTDEWEQEETLVERILDEAGFYVDLPWRSEVVALWAESLGGYVPRPRVLDALKPRAVSTVEELEALPVGSVVLDVTGLAGQTIERENDRFIRRVNGNVQQIRHSQPFLPARVLFTPEETQDTTDRSE